MATRAAEQPVEDPRDERVAANIRDEMRRVINDLNATLAAERQLRRNLLERMRVEVERGDRLLVEVGIAVPLHAG